MVEAREQNGAQRLLKSFTYGSDNDSGAGDYRLAKVVEAVRNTYAPDSTFGMKETYVYAGLGGNISERDTWLGDTKSFTLTATWDETGRLASLTYPTCVAGFCAGAGETAGGNRFHPFLKDCELEPPGNRFS